jgi:excinuclease ABC subunit B
MKRAIEEVTRRRKIQQAYNKKHKITPTSIIKALGETRLSGMKKEVKEEPEQLELNFGKLDKKQQIYYLEELRDQMDLAAKNLDFEQAANLRDKISTLKQLRSKKKHRV